MNSELYSLFFAGGSLQVHSKTEGLIIDVHDKKIPPNLPFPKGGIIPSLAKRGQGRFSGQISITEGLIIDVHDKKIPPNLPFPKGGIIPSLAKRGQGRFSGQISIQLQDYL